jgi:ABC-type multidrug transport system permease subunit
MIRPFFQLILVQFREFYREPAVLFWSIIFPVAMAWGLGIAFNKKTELIKTVAIVENSDVSLSKLVNNKDINTNKNYDTKKKFYYYEIQTGSKTEGFTTYKIVITDWESAIKMLKRGNISLILDNKDNKINYHYDPANAEGQLAYLQLSGAFSGFSFQSAKYEFTPLTQKGTRYIDFLIPGLIAMNVMMSTMWGISYGLIEARSKKLLRRMVATPMSKAEYLFSHFIARVILCSIEATIIYIFARYYFDMHIEGNVGSLILLFISGVIAFFGISVLVASRTAKTQIGNGLINAVVMPMMIVSGIFFSYHNFPDSVTPYIQILPLTLLADGVRSIFIEGSGFKEVWATILILNGIGFATFLGGLKVYKWY